MLLAVQLVLVLLLCAGALRSKVYLPKASPPPETALGQ